MTRFGVAPWQAKHTGKSGFLKTSTGTPKPIPYGFIEEISSNLYPEVRDYLPKDVKSYTDSYYDLRNEKYQFWYDKWGKPHINKWWIKQLDETLRISKAWKKQTQMGYAQRYPTQSKFNGQYNTNRRPTRYLHRNCKCKCRRIYDSRSYRGRQAVRRVKWTTRWKYYSKY